MRQTLCPVLVGRDEDLAILGSALDQAAEGRGSAVFVTGEAGVGKSRLLQEASRLAVARGIAVLTGRSVPGAMPVPFRPFTEAVFGLLRGRNRPTASADRPLGVVLDRLMPEIDPGRPGPIDASPLVLGEVLLRFLGEIGTGTSCLLVLEDLHWADPESLAVLEYLVDNLEQQRLVCLGSLRAAPDGAAPDLVSALVARRAAQLLALDRLGDADTVRVARACLDATWLPAAVEEFLVACTEGSPFLIEEVLAGLVTEGRLVEQDGCWSVAGALNWRAPPSFADGVRRRLGILNPPDRRVLHSAAVLGRRFDWSLLAEISGLADAQVGAALRLGVDTQLLVAEVTTFRFRHALTREAVLADLLPPERAELAGRALAAVRRAHSDLPDPWCELAADLAEAADQRSTAAELLLDAARRAIARGALAGAAARLARAAELAADDHALMIRIEDARVDIFALSGQVDSAFATGRRLLGRLDPANLSTIRVADLHLRLARAAVAAGRWDVAQDHLSACRAGADGQELVARVEALSAQVHLGRGDLDLAGRLAENALHRAERAGAPEVACEALEVSGRVARQRDLESAEAAFERQSDVAAAHGLGLWRLRALHELGTLDQLRTESVERLRRARQLAADAGALALGATLDLQIAAGLIKQFRADEAEAAARRSVDVARRLRLAVLPIGLVYLACVRAQRADASAMEAFLTEAITLAPDDLDVQGCAWGHCRATLSLLTEDRGQALAQMTTGARLLMRSPATVSPPFLGLRVLLLATEERPDVDRVRSEAELVRTADATRHRLVGSLLRFADAALLGHEGDRAAAEAAFADADGQMGPLVAWHRQYARRLLAPSALADGWGEPVQWLREAAGYFADRGDRDVAAACRSLLRRAGAQVPRRGRGDTPVPEHLRALGITGREAEVLALVADGLTNRELGARLHLSPRTVEKHVAGLLAKTGCRRRAQLVGYFARQSG